MEVEEFVDENVYNVFYTTAVDTDLCWMAVLKGDIDMGRTDLRFASVNVPEFFHIFAHELHLACLAKL